MQTAAKKHFEVKDRETVRSEFSLVRLGYRDYQLFQDGNFLGTFVLQGVETFFGSKIADRIKKLLPGDHFKFVVYAEPNRTAIKGIANLVELGDDNG